MKKIISIVILGLMLSSSYAIQAELKVAAVNINRVMLEAPKFKSANQAIDSEFKIKTDQLKSKANEIKTLQDGFKRDFDTMSEDQKRVKSEEIRTKAKDFNDREKTIIQEFNQKRNEKLQELQKLLSTQIQSLANEQGYDLVLTQGVAFATPSVDITDKLIARLQ